MVLFLVDGQKPVEEVTMSICQGVSIRRDHRIIAEETSSLQLRSLLSSMASRAITHLAYAHSMYPRAPEIVDNLENNSCSNEHKGRNPSAMQCKRKCPVS